MFQPRERKKLFDNFIHEFNTKFKKNLSLSEDFVKNLLSRDSKEKEKKGKFISTFYYPRIVDISDLKEDRNIEIFCPIPKSMEELLYTFYENNIKTVQIQSPNNDIYSKLKIFPLTFKGRNITFQVIKIDKSSRNRNIYTISFIPKDEKIEINADFNENGELFYPYSIFLNGNEYEIGKNSYITKKDNKKKSEIENNIRNINKYLVSLNHSIDNFKRYNTDQYYKEIFPETNIIPCLQDLDARRNTLKNKLEEENKQLEDINIENKNDNEKIEELRSEIETLKIEPIILDEIKIEKENIKESQKKLVYFQFIEKLSKYYYEEKIDTNISDEIEELFSILGYYSSNNTYPSTLVPSLTNQLKYLTKKEVPIQEILIQQKSTQPSIQLTPTLSISTVVEKVKSNQLQLSNLNNIVMIFSNIKKYLNLTFPNSLLYNESQKQTNLNRLNEIELYFKNNYH